MPTKPDLTVRWSKKEKALLYDGSKPTGGLLAGVFEGLKMGELYHYDSRDPRPGDERTLAQELEERGYDLSTLRFSIRKKK